MNASDIVKAKQNKATALSYQQTFTLNSTVQSTIYQVSSIAGGTTRYGSTLNTVYDKTCMPTFTTYETRNKVNESPCTACNQSSMEWKNTNSTLMYAYQSIYGTLSTTSTVLRTSTSVNTAPHPDICDRVSYRQGTHFGNL
jgi:hypothetical protein